MYLKEFLISLEKNPTFELINEFSFILSQPQPKYLRKLIHTHLLTAFFSTFDHYILSILHNEKISFKNHMEEVKLGIERNHPLVIALVAQHPYALDSTTYLHTFFKLASRRNWTIIRKLLITKRPHKNKSLDRSDMACKYLLNKMDSRNLFLTAKRNNKVLIRWLSKLEDTRKDRRFALKMMAYKPFIINDILRKYQSEETEEKEDFRKLETIFNLNSCGKKFLKKKEALRLKKYFNFYPESLIKDKDS